jgi:two-component system chemotaxis response regulator CheY
MARIPICPQLETRSRIIFRHRGEGWLLFTRNLLNSTTIDDAYLGNPIIRGPDFMSTPVNLEKLRVLVIDDDAAARGMLCEMLRRMKISQFVEAEDGQAGLAHVREPAAEFDLVICDWNMPRMNGLEFTVLAREERPALKVLMVTGRADFESIVEAKRSGITGYIVKPFSPRELREKIEHTAR